jgi:hypothetical protein
MFYILQASLITKYMNEPMNPYIIYFFLFYIIYKATPCYIISYINDTIEHYFTTHYNTSSIFIPFHLKVYSGYNQKSMVKTLYSQRFHAINHHLKKYHIDKISSMTEIINFENGLYLDINKSDFILIPKDSQVIQVDNDQGINIELIYDSVSEEKDDKEKTKSLYTSKKYVYRIFKRDTKQVSVLNDFVEQLEKEYLNDTCKYEQIVFEYKKSYNDDEDCTSISFNETPFHTNKSFDNIFFEDKSDFIDYLKPFVKSRSKIVDMKKYQKYGIPFKGISMLHGPPGCGKSSLIKSAIKYTGRHCVLVSWSKLKTCSEFVALFRPLKIGNRVYEQSELVIVFEDFDANNSEILKTRDNLKTSTKTNAKNGVELSEEKLKKICEENFLVPMTSAANIDNLNLEYILNVLEGIVELHNSLVFFTTNDLEAIDPALKRVGRMDKTIKMDYITKSVLEEMLCYYYNMKTLQKYSKKIASIVKSKTCYANIVHIISKTDTIDEFFKMV